MRAALELSDDVGFDLGQGLPACDAATVTEEARHPAWWMHHITGNPSHEGRAAAICRELVYGDPETARRWATELRDEAVGR